MLILNRFWRQGATLFGHTPLTSTSTSGSGTARLPREEEEAAMQEEPTRVNGRLVWFSQSQSESEMARMFETECQLQILSVSVCGSSLLKNNVRPLKL